MSEKIGEIEELGEDLDGVLQAYHKTEATLRRYLTTSLACLKREREKNARHVAGAEQTQRLLRETQDENKRLKRQLDRIQLGPRDPREPRRLVVGVRVRHKPTGLLGTIEGEMDVSNDLAGNEKIVWTKVWRVECKVGPGVVYGEWPESELEIWAGDDLEEAAKTCPL